MNALRCLIADDEPIAREIIAEYINLVPGLELAHSCSNALEAFRKLHDSTDTDVMFIDINMPEMTGLELVRSLKHPPLIVFTTAHSQHALDGFELNATDYLVKPVSFERFVRCADKLFRQLGPQRVLVQNHAEHTGNRQDFIFVRSDKGLEKLWLQDLMYVEGFENYVKLVCQQRTIVTLNTMKNMEALLPANRFLRIHRSYIINTDKIESFQDNGFKIHKEILLVGKSYRRSVGDWVKGYSF